MRALGTCAIVAAIAAEAAPPRPACASARRSCELQDGASFIQAYLDRHEASRSGGPEDSSSPSSFIDSDARSLLGNSGSSSSNVSGNASEPVLFAPDYDYLHQPESRWLVYPKQKLAFCYIEKNACTQFNQLFNRLNGIPQQNLTWMEYYKSNLVEQNMTMADISHSNGWLWGVFLRNPIDRYISAWGSKCVQKEDEGRHCIPAGMFASGSKDDLKLNVEANLKNRTGLLSDPHWAPQSAFCGGLNGTRDFDFVGSLSGDVNQQVKDMLRMAKIDRHFVDQFFPVHGVSGHKFRKVMVDSYTRAQVRELYEEDFELDFPAMS